MLCGQCLDFFVKMFYNNPIYVGGGLDCFAPEFFHKRT